MKNNQVLKAYIAPVFVLVCVCLIVTAALAATFSVADPIIRANAKKTADAARIELLSSADKFSKFDGELYESNDGKTKIEDCYIADNKTGMVITVSSKSFGGPLIEMVGIDKNGKITGVKVLSAQDTPGLGTKAQTPEHLAQYKGLSELLSPSCKEDTQVKHISGATISSNAVHYGVYSALHQFQLMGGVS